MKKNLKTVIDNAIKESKAKSVTMPAEAKGKSDKEEVKAFFKALSINDRSTLEKISTNVRRKDQSGSTPADGGYLVPESVSSTVIKKLHDISPIRQVATIISNMPAKLRLPMEDALPTTSWVGEGDGIVDTKATFGKAELTPHKLAGLDSFTTEVLADAAINPNIQAYVLDRFAVSLELAESEAFTIGDGTDRPFGFTTATAKEVESGGVNMTADSIKELFYLLTPQYRASAVFLMNDVNRARVDNLKDSVDRYLWNDNLATGGAATLMGRPVVFNPYLPDDEIWFAYMPAYVIGDRLGVTVDTGLNADDFAKAQISMRVMKRVAGVPTHNEAFAKLTMIGLPLAKKK